MTKGLFTAAMIALAGPALAHDAMNLNVMQELKPDELKYKDDPAFPKGAQTVVLLGDPSKPGLFVLRAKFPPNYVVPPHTHPVFETVTIMSGTLGNAMGNKFDPSKGQMLKTGSVLALPPNHAHYVWTTDEEVVVQVTAIGPFGLTYVNPEDDPRKK